MSPDDFYKKHLDEAEFEAAQKEGAQKVLSVLRNQPATMSRAEPPLGYEEDLLRALRLKLPLQKATPVAPASTGFWEFKFLNSPALSWTMAGVFALVAIVTTFNFRTAPESVSGDLLAQTAQKGSVSEVDGWVASVGDGALQRRVARADMDTLAQDLESKEDSQVIESVLKDVARTMGMK